MFAVSTFDTDYLLVKAERFPEAVAALRGAGHTVEGVLDMTDQLRPAEVTPMLQAIAMRSRARLAWSRGDPEGVETGLKEAAGLFREIGAVPWLAAALADLGTWLAERGDEESGFAAAREAEEIYTRLGAIVPLEKLRARVKLERPIQVDSDSLAGQATQPVN